MTWSDVAQIAQTVALLLISGALIVLFIGLARLLQIVARLEAHFQSWQDQVRPLVEVSREIGEDLRAVSRKMRGEVERMGDLARRGVEGLDHALEAARDRLQRLNDLLDLVENELEGALIGSLSVLRGVRAGFSTLRRRRRGREARSAGDREDEE